MIYKSNKILFTTFIISFLVYITSCFGVFDWISTLGAKALYNSFGYTNKWSHTYGPSWFLSTVNNISSLGSREIVFLFAIFLYLYLKFNRSNREAKNFIFTIGSGIILIFIIKSITTKQEELTLNAILSESISNFPSGHAFIATVLYFSFAKYLSNKISSHKSNEFLFIFASIIILLVGISMFLGGEHTITEIIAGWSLGLCWYSFTQLFLRMDPKSIFSK
jgi:undecaprenyl-diphosphatase